MPSSFTCPHCGAETNVSEEFLGTSGPCAHCGKTISVPAAGTAAAVAVPAKRSPGSAVIIIVVLAVLAVLGALVVCGVVALTFGVTAYDGVRRDGNLTAATVQIGLLENQLALYKLSMKDYPTTDQGLDALVQAPADLVNQNSWAGPYMEGGQVPNDPWGNPYQYESPGKYNQNSFDVWSFGVDGTDGTDDDVGNWNEW